MTPAALLDSPGAFGAVRRGVMIYGVLAALALVAVIVVAGTGHTVNTFMWVRAILLPVLAVPIHRMVLSASRGSRRAFERVSTLSAVMPIAIIGVDLIPGICPPWYAGTQVVCMLPVIGVAVAVRRSDALRDAFPKKS
ncbi:hypothetical protein EBO15_36875 [Actinomadura harenae]|uniref:Uncharacterized protein n=1 Tax=Actinomadura harenae TaxID=2483351 RepID=A0A3M2LHY9_9ACTN|nr:hypothetical protein EBO15_36875 [Actinomadura harenae]